MNLDGESVTLARRALVHLREKTTDQAPGTLEQPIEAYTDPARYQREVDRAFRHLPLALALSLELPGPGSYRAMTVLDVPVLLVRGNDGVARAFLNVCRHRGAQVCKPGNGTAERLVCPYHAWQYDLLGQLTGLFGASTFGDVSAQTHSLTPLQCDERAGLLWVILTPGESLAIDPWLGEFADKLGALHLDQWHLHEQRDIAGPGWKVVWEGYLESYHHNTVHVSTATTTRLGSNNRQSLAHTFNL